MRRAVPALVAILLAAPAAAGGEAPRWVTYVAAAPDELSGALRAVRTDGRDLQTLIEEGISRADAGPDAVFAIREDETSPPQLVRRELEGPGSVTVDVGPGEAFAVAASASPTGAVAFLRFVETTLEVPEHLETALRPLRRPLLPVLVPPDRPGGTTGTVVDATRDFYHLLFTNDPDGVLAHAEQVNVFVTGSEDVPPPLPAEMPVPVRETAGRFSCGASACFLDWEELGVSYSVGEFGNPDDAVAFAESLVTADELLGPTWRGGPGDFQVPELVVLEPTGRERVIESVDTFCECGFSPVDWDDAGERLLVIFGAEGFTSLQEYAGEGEPTQLLEGGFEDDLILDAAYGSDGPLVLVSQEFGPPGDVRALDGETLVAGVRAFDVEGTTLAYVREDGAVVVRDLATGEERQVGDGAIDVSLSAGVAGIGEEPAPEPPAPPAAGDEEGFPWPLAGGIGGGAVLLLGGAWLVARARRR